MTMKANDKGNLESSLEKSGSGWMMTQTALLVG